MKKIFYTLLLGLGLQTGLQAQKAWVVPEMFNPDDSVTLFVDVSQCECNRLAGTTEDVFMWTWSPSDPVAGNGAWTASNPDMVMTRSADDPDVYYMKFVPEAFYVDVSDLYKNGFKFLAKLSDGTGEGGGGCDEDKTEDLEVPANPIPGCATKYCQNPKIFFDDDFFTFVYNSGAETKPSMTEDVVGEENYGYWTRAILDDGTEDGIIVTYANYGDIVNYPELRLAKDPEDGLYKSTFIPEAFWSALNPDGWPIREMYFTVINVNYTGPNDVSDGRHKADVGCQ